MVARKRGGGAPAKPAKASRTELSAEAKTQRMQALVKEVEQFGVKPQKPAELFVIQGPHAFTLHVENLVSLKRLSTYQGAYPENLRRTREEAEWLRRARLPLCINAGTPVMLNPKIGACFHNTGFVPLDSETHERRWFEPKPLNFELSPQPYCSDADVLARYAGHRALLSEDGARDFLIFFLNEGDPNIVDRPDDSVDTVEQVGEEWDAYRRQKDRILGNLRKLVLVYPHRVEPVLNGDGSRQPRMNQILPDADAHEVPFMVACFATLQSDKRPGSPCANAQFSIGGYHQRCRLWPLHLKVLKKIRQVMDHFDIDLPALRNPRAGTLQLDAYRAEALAKIGPPPMTLTQGLGLDPAWLAARAAAPFVKPWVQECSFHHPDGKVDAESGKPVLVPVYKGSAEERNGHCWLDPAALGPTSPHSQILQELLAKLTGRVYRPPDEYTDKITRELRESLRHARAEALHWRTKYEALCEQVKHETLLGDSGKSP